MNRSVDDLKSWVSGSNKQLRSMCLVCKLWRAEAQHLLFENIVFDTYTRKCSLGLKDILLSPSRTATRNVTERRHMNAYQVKNVIICDDYGIDVVLSVRSELKSLRNVFFERPPWLTLEKIPVSFYEFLKTPPLARVVWSQTVRSCSDLHQLQEFVSSVEACSIRVEVHVRIMTVTCYARDFLRIPPFPNIASVRCVLGFEPMGELEDFCGTLAGMLFQWDLPSIRFLGIELSGPRKSVLDYILIRHGRKLSHLSYSADTAELHDLDFVEMRSASLGDLAPNLHWLQTNTLTIAYNYPDRFSSVKTLDLDTEWRLPRPVSLDSYEINLFGIFADRGFFPSLKRIIIREDSIHRSKYLLFARDVVGERVLQKLESDLASRRIELVDRRGAEMGLFFSTRRSVAWDENDLDLE